MPLFTLQHTDKWLKAHCKKHVLKFKQPAGTSRGIMLEKVSYIIYIEYLNHPGIIGIGECSPIWGLSIDPKEDYESLLLDICADINNYKAWMYDRLTDYPSIYFGLEMALKDLEQGGKRVFFPSKFTKSEDTIEINGLVWMGDIDFMEQQIEAKIKEGFDCIKLKIGSLEFEEEINLLRQIRNKYPENKLNIRLDANGAFSPSDVDNKLTRLSEFDVHSVEQPIKAGNWKLMKKICASSPIPIALDEELIGIVGWEKKQDLIKTIQPQYIIIKPSLVGGFKSAEGWINVAKAFRVKWWITSALESNVGLNAIAQFTYATGNKLPQGLGTGSLFTNNIGDVDFLESKQFHFRQLNISK